MSNAFRLKRTDFVNGVQHFLNGLEENVTAELDARETQWQNKYDTLKAEAENTQKRLELENETLSAQVASLKAALDQTHAHRPTGTTDTTGSVDEQQPDKCTESTDNSRPDSNRLEKTSSEAITELQRSLEKSRSRYEALKNKLEVALDVARRRKAQLLDWVKYSDSLELRIKKLEKKVTDGRQSTVAVPPADPATSSTSHTAAPDISLTPVTLEKPPLLAHGEVEKPSLSASFTSASSSFLGNTTAGYDGVEPELPPQVLNAIGEGQNNDATLESTQSDPSSYASQPELNTPSRAAGDNEPSSDGPEVVWERPVKKARISDEQTGRNGRKTPTNAPPILPAVKKENSGSVQWAGIAHYRGSQESVDLDEGQLPVATPRKRQLFYQNQQFLSERESNKSSENASQEIPAAESAQCPQTGLPPLATPLAPLSVNVRRGVKDPMRAAKYLKRGIESLTEDNCMSNGASSNRAAMEPPTTTKTSRLNSLLNSRPVEPSPVLSLARATPSIQRNHDHDLQSPKSGMYGRPPPTRILPRLRDCGNQLPKTPTAAAPAPSETVRGDSEHTAAIGSTLRQRDAREQAGPLATPTANSAIAALIAAKSDDAAKKAPLRGRAVGQLKMDDFKINSAVNNGETFAYNEVVRGRADRANLAGCTDPQCCGKAFRGMVMSELNAAGNGHINRPDNIVLMERHLSDDAFLLARMSPEEKRELWIEARTKELADKYGKHRHRYHRRASPPGFWDTDFPTMQEDEHNRAEAEKVERILVQERYREAMRPGGRWLFRDE